MPLVLALCAAILGQILMFLVACIIGSGLGIDLPFVSYLVLMPSVALIASLPISIGGWGVREGGMVVGFMLFDVPPEKSLLMGLLVGVASLAAFLPGGLLWLLRKNRPLVSDLRGPKTA